jgi:hypothetical protein
MEQLRSAVSQLVEQSELRDLDTYWNSTLDKLESENGELPIERVALLEFAASQGLTKPEDAYWRVAGPARRQVEEAVKAAQARVAKAGSAIPDKKDATSARPKSSSADSDVPIAKGVPIRDAVGEVAKKLFRDLGID